jgi:hypothetical protein
MDELPGPGRDRVVQLLDDRAFKLRKSIHEEFDAIWTKLVFISRDTATITIYSNDAGEELHTHNGAKC